MDETAQYKEAFKMFANNTDTISKESLTSVLKQLGFKVSAAEVTEMIEEANEGGRTVSFNEFHTLMTTKLDSIDDADSLIRAFESFDANSTGLITHDEFKNILSFGGTKKFEEKEIREFLKLGDKGEGKFDYTAFCKQISSK